MADFTSEFWNWYVIVLVGGSILACFLLIWWLGGRTLAPGEKAQSMGHVWDGTLEELNNPLPKWWLNLFYITLFFSIGYLILYPGLGRFAGLLGWTELGSYADQVRQAEEKYGPLFAQYRDQSLKALGQDAKAMKIGERLFASYCTQCHGSDAGGGPGFPNLRDKDWLWGGTPEAIEQTILDGRTGAMPAWQGVLGDAGVDQVAAYVLNLSGRQQLDAAKVAAGKTQFQTLCIGCHGLDGTGNPMLGAPNLTDTIWLYGGSPAVIKRSIADGRSGRMPGHREFLGTDKVHLLAAYIYNLSAH